MTAARTSARYLRAADQIPDGAAPRHPGPVDTTPIVGVWWNANHRTWGISRIEMTERDGRVWMHLWAEDPEAGRLRDWGEVEIERVYTDGPFSNRAAGCVAHYDLGHARTRFEINAGYGLVVLSGYTTFTDGSGRLSYFSREFYHRGKVS